MEAGNGGQARSRLARQGLCWSQRSEIHFESRLEMLWRQLFALARDFAAEPQQVGRYVADLEALGHLSSDDKWQIYAQMAVAAGVAFANRAFGLKATLARQGNRAQTGLQTGAGLASSRQPAAAAQGATLADRPATLQRVQALAPALHLAAERMDIRCDEPAAQQASAQGASGLMAAGVMCLAADDNDPDTTLLRRSGGEPNRRVPSGIGRLIRERHGEQSDGDEIRCVSDILEQAKRSDCQPLPPALRQRVENQLGHGLGHVKIHTDEESADIADAIHARAFTLGEHIFFNQSEWSPDTADGAKLLLHELVHVVQADESRLPAPQAGGLTVSQPDDAVEREAQSVAGAAAVQDRGGISVPARKTDASAGAQAFDSPQITRTPDPKPPVAQVSPEKGEPKTPASPQQVAADKIRAIFPKGVLVCFTVGEAFHSKEDAAKPENLSRVEADEYPWKMEWNSSRYDEERAPRIEEIRKKYQPKIDKEMDEKDRQKLEKERDEEISGEKWGDDMANARKKEIMKDIKKDPAALKRVTDTAFRNNDEIVKKANDFAQAHDAIHLEAGQIRFGAPAIILENRSSPDIASKVGEIHEALVKLLADNPPRQEQAVQAEPEDQSFPPKPKETEPLPSPQPMPGPPPGKPTAVAAEAAKIRFMTISAHGWRDGLGGKGYVADTRIKTDDVPLMVNPMADCLADDVRVMLFACSAGASPDKEDLSKMQEEVKQQARKAVRCQRDLEALRNDLNVLPESMKATASDLWDVWSKLANTQSALTDEQRAALRDKAQTRKQEILDAIHQRLDDEENPLKGREQAALKKLSNALSQDLFFKKMVEAQQEQQKAAASKADIEQLKPNPAEGSVADAFVDALAAVGKTGAGVGAHTESGHTTTNHKMRFISGTEQGGNQTSRDWRPRDVFTDEFVLAEAVRLKAVAPGVSLCTQTRAEFLSLYRGRLERSGYFKDGIFSDHIWKFMTTEAWMAEDLAPDAFCRSCQALWQKKVPDEGSLAKVFLKALRAKHPQWQALGPPGQPSASKP